MEYQKSLEILLSISVIFIFVLCIFLGRFIILNQEKNECYNHIVEDLKTANKYSDEIEKAYAKEFEKRGIELHNAKLLNDFLGEQNILLSHQAGLIPDVNKSEIVKGWKDEKVKQAFNKFLDVLQTSK